MESLEAIAEHIVGQDDFILISHVSPDGDALGCETALFNALRSIGKRVRAVCHDPVPEAYAFIPASENITVPDAARPAKNAIALDCADRGRMGTAAELFDKAEHTVNIDHHGTNTGFADMNYVSPGSAAAAQCVLELIKLMGCDITKDIASSLYTGIMTDTGNFAYSNTAPDTFRAAAELAEAGADCSELNRLAFRTVSLAKTKLMGKVLSSFKLYFDGRLACAVLTAADIEACGATGADCEGIVENLRDIKSVEIAALIREENGKWKVSFRSKSYADVGRLAAAMGGGGHKAAAGCTVEGDIGILLGRITECCGELL